MADVIAEIKKLIKEDKLVIGKDEVLKGLRTGKFEKVFVAENCPAELMEDLEKYAPMNDVEIVSTGVQNVELGDVCKKPFSIAVLGLLK